MRVLGLSAYYHDSAAALVEDGRIIAAAQEERFTRKKGDASFPREAVRYCLQEAKVSLNEVDWVGYYDKPLATFDRLMETHLAYAPRGFSAFSASMPVWLKKKLGLKALLRRELDAVQAGSVPTESLLFGTHHQSHAASAFFPSPFPSAAVLVMDGVGEWATTTIAKGSGTRIDLLWELRFPHSLGLLYAAFTSHLGFAVNDGEYKVMGLAPYGEPCYSGRIFEHLVDLKSDGSFRLNMDHFRYCTDDRMTSPRFGALFDGLPPRRRGEPLTKPHVDLACSVQAVLEEIVLRLARTAHRETGERNLCLAGGVALNCVANGRLLREGLFTNLWIQPAAGDAGGALGVALTIAHAAGAPRATGPSEGDSMSGAFLGPRFEMDEVRAVLRRRGVVFDELAGEGEVTERIVAALVSGAVVGCFRGRMEFGPRALGNRSILADARVPAMQRELNLRIKYRESFRPFAPVVLREDAKAYFDLDCDSPYMLLVAPVRASRRRVQPDDGRASSPVDRINEVRSDIPAVTHVDYSARIQTVDGDTNPFMYRLLRRMREHTGCSVLLNTSFNVRDEPIVCSPDDAVRCFMGTEMDVLAMENAIVYKSAQG